jgi:hypothetical protein
MFPTFISNIQRNVSLPGFLQVCFKALADLFPNLFCQRQPKSFFFFVLLQIPEPFSISRYQNFKRHSVMRFSALGASCFGTFAQKEIS